MHKPSDDMVPYMVFRQIVPFLYNFLSYLENLGISLTKLRYGVGLLVTGST